MSLTENFWNAYVGYLDRMRERKLRRRTVKAISDLQPHLLRDIGWPTAFDDNPRRRTR